MATASFIVSGVVAIRPKTARMFGEADIGFSGGTDFLAGSGSGAWSPVGGEPAGSGKPAGGEFEEDCADARTPPIAKSKIRETDAPLNRGEYKLQSSYRAVALSQAHDAETANHTECT